MSLAQRIDEYVRACFTGIWIQSHEHADAIAELHTHCAGENWRLATWNVASGLKLVGGETIEGCDDPLAAVRAAEVLSGDHGEHEPETTTLLVLENFHRFLQSAEIIQTLAQQILRGKHSRTILVVLAPTVQLPLELEKLFVVVEHELPSRVQLLEIAEGIATESEEMPRGDQLERVLDAASGLTRYEAENAFSLSLVRDGRLLPETLWQQKSQLLTKTGSLSLYRGDADFESLGGLTSLKAFTRRALLRSGKDTLKVRPRGVLLLSPPGCGKSEFCRALGLETGRPVLQLDVGALMGSLVGQSEERTRQALQVADAMSPCILMIDELDKAFAGVAGSAGNDSGVSSRMFGTFLSWLNDHESDVFVVCTCNDISRLPPEFSRSERFDGVFFVDLPGREQKDAIWNLYLRTFELDIDQRRPGDDHWTGAEIRACCRLSRLLDVPLAQAAENVVPVAVTAAESVERLRTWASTRCLDADRPGIYQHSAKRRSGRRRVARETPSNN